MSMKTLISHRTALNYWRIHFPIDAELGLNSQVSHSEAVNCRKTEILADVPETLIEPNAAVDVLVFEKAQRRQSKQIISHVWETALPEGSFYREWGVYISSPEFVFLQLAAELTVSQLIALGCEFCGTYVLVPKGAQHASALDECPTRVAPLTNLEKLAAFIDAAGPARGKEKARRALRYIVEGSRSPMETMVYMLLCLPPKLGGYSFPKAQMNAYIEFDEEARRLAGSHHGYGDICWPNPKLDIEYHGEVHVGASNMKHDVGRELGIEHMGWHVITVTSPQVFGIEEFETIAKEAAKRVGKRLHAEHLGRTQQRCALHDELERWMFEAL